ncbi:MAG TPA: hypothetical protein VD963_07890 [Phycisphaerales bacterium]|nr:hypothetical protein [Phycisphaerales bacterium]
MSVEEVYAWVAASQRRVRVLWQMVQPLTAGQIARRVGLALASCSYVLWEFSMNDVASCLNGSSKRNRVYWLTPTGVQCQARLFAAHKVPLPAHDFPSVDWNLYGDMCFRHRSAMIRSLAEPLQPSEARRRARQHNPGLRMSGNNARDVVRSLLRSDLVEPVEVPGQRHRRYVLSDAGRQFRQLLLGADSVTTSYDPTPASDGGRRFPAERVGA